MNRPAATQRGAVLVISLILLLLLTILAITASSTASLQERMAGNAQEANIAFQAAESGLKNMTDIVARGGTPATDALLELEYRDGQGNVARRIRARMQSISQVAEGSSLSLSPGTPDIIMYDLTSTSTLDPNATSAGQITNNNAAARHLQGYRDRIIR